MECIGFKEVKFKGRGFNVLLVFKVSSSIWTILLSVLLR